MGVDRAPVSGRIAFVGSVLWHDERPFDTRDLADLIVARDRVPGADPTTPLVAVSRVPATIDGPAVTYSPEDLLTAWRT